MSKFYQVALRKMIGRQEEDNVSIEKRKNVRIENEEENETKSKETSMSDKKQTTIINNIQREMKFRKCRK